MTQSDKWRSPPRPAVRRYREFCDLVALLNVKLPTQGAVITFLIPMPKSWSKKKRRDMFMMPHESRPDISNLLKAIEDAVYRGLDRMGKAKDDSRIWHYGGIEKRWADEGAIIINQLESLP
jgi:Holliday junction resolvase RusA-like endonuclease